MRRSILYLSLICLLMFNSCAEVRKQVAVDDIAGKYYGKPAVILQWSKLNLGLEDEVSKNTQNEVVEIKKETDDNASLVFDDGLRLKMNNINLATNGVIFNIPNQRITLKVDGREYYGSMKGLNECLYGESTCDGFFDSKNNKLNFSLSGIINITVEGLSYDVPIAASYSEFIKLSK